MSESIATGVRVTRRYSQPAERVFDAWLDPFKARKFLFATPAGTIIRAELEARPGGRFVITDRRPDGDIEHTGEYLEIERPRRIVFRLVVPKYSPKSTIVRINIAPRAPGCELILVQEGVSPDMELKTREGWATILEAAAAAA
jgi:uncharacterized protein YndB with AHSA1/START domain